MTKHFQAAQGTRLSGYQAYPHPQLSPDPSRGGAAPPPPLWGSQGAFTPDNWHKVHFKSGHHSVGSPEDNLTVPLPDLPGWLSVILSVCGSGILQRVSDQCQRGWDAPVPLAPGPPALASRCC